VSRHYSDPLREHDKWSLPDLEVFYAEAGELEACNGDDGTEPHEASSRSVTRRARSVPTTV